MFALVNITVLVGPFEDALKLHEATGGAGASIVSNSGGGAKAAGGGVRILEDQWPSPPRRRAPVAPNEDQLRRETWYHSRMSRRDAEKLLVRDGDFLVRESTTNPGQYVLTGMHCGLPKHLLLVDPEGVVSSQTGNEPARKHPMSTVLFVVGYLQNTFPNGVISLLYMK